MVERLNDAKKFANYYSNAINRIGKRARQRILETWKHKIKSYSLLISNLDGELDPPKVLLHILQVAVGSLKLDGLQEGTEQTKWGLSELKKWTSEAGIENTATLNELFRTAEKESDARRRNLRCDVSAFAWVLEDDQHATCADVSDGGEERSPTIQDAAIAQVPSGVTTDTIHVVVPFTPATYSRSNRAMELDHIIETIPRHDGKSKYGDNPYSRSGEKSMGRTFQPEVRDIRADQETEHQAGSDSGRRETLPAPEQEEKPEFIDVFALQANNAWLECNRRLEELKRPSEQLQEKYKDDNEAHLWDISRAENEAIIWRDICETLREAAKFRKILRTVNATHKPPREPEWYKGPDRLDHITSFMFILEDAVKHVDKDLSRMGSLPQLREILAKFQETLRTVDITRGPPEEQEWCKGPDRLDHVTNFMSNLEDAIGHVNRDLSRMESLVQLRQILERLRTFGRRLTRLLTTFLAIGLLDAKEEVTVEQSSASRYYACN